MDVGRVTGAAKRRRERRLRSMLRHERQTVTIITAEMQGRMLRTKPYGDRKTASSRDAAGASGGGGRAAGVCPRRLGARTLACLSSLGAVAGWWRPASKGRAQEAAEGGEGEEGEGAGGVGGVEEEGAGSRGSCSLSSKEEEKEEEEKETSSQLFLSSLGCPASWSVWTRRTFLPRHRDRFRCPRCMHLETWTFYEPLVSGTLLFGACHAGGEQENFEFSGRCLRGIISAAPCIRQPLVRCILRSLVSDSHLFGVRPWSTRLWIFWKTTSTLQKTAESPQLQFIDGRRHSLRYAEADPMVQLVWWTIEITQLQFVFGWLMSLYASRAGSSSAVAVHQVRRQFPGRGAEADSHGPCDHGDSTVAVACWAGLAVRAQLWETVEIPQLQPVSSLDQVVDIPVVAQMLIPLVRLP